MKLRQVRTEAEQHRDKSVLKVLLKVRSAYTLLTVELRQVSVKGAAEGEISSAYTLLTVELRQVSVKGAAEGEISLHTAHGGAETSQC